jgi:hypothetical protein
MNAQLAAVAAEFDAALQRMRHLERTLLPEQWTRRPALERWSAIECIQHLNLTAEATLPRVRQGIAEAQLRSRPAPARYRRDVMGWVIWRGLRQSARFKSKTTAAFVPHAGRPIAEILATFTSLQADHAGLVRDCDGLPVDRIRIASPFNERVRYNVYAALTILAVHQHRHLWQAEQAAAGH